MEAKLNSLDREFTLLKNRTMSIDWCQQYWWDLETGILTFDDWKQVDAMYRSRALDLPGTGHAVVPCVDMANHASADDTSALYETDSNGDAILLLRDGKKITSGGEVAITYGDEKGACEMLFSYGFIESTMISAKELFLDIDISDDDPLRLAKKAVAKSAPGFRLFNDGDSTGWESSFIWLLCVNEEDGLDFKLLQINDSERELQAYWKEKEIENMLQLSSLLEAEPLWDIFNLRAISTLQNRVEKQLFILKCSKKYIKEILETWKHDDNARNNALKLRDLEETLLLHAYEDFETKVFQIFQFKIRFY